mmetsp:Transcript_124349/g.215534  ORF Transcript_124349/g.215534 Transcript_124349/m.215534 type:complete len:298 (+) Transcript_124349:1650-2543(+)
MYEPVGPLQFGRVGERLGVPGHGQAHQPPLGIPEAVSQRQGNGGPGAGGRSGGQGLSEGVQDRQRSPRAPARPVQLLVPPEPGLRVEAVLAQQAPAVLRNQLHSLEDVLELLFAGDVAEAQAGPAQLGPFLLPRCLPHGLTRFVVDLQQAVPVGPGARAAPAGLDPEEVVEQGHDVVVVQVPPPEERVLAAGGAAEGDPWGLQLLLGQHHWDDDQEGDDCEPGLGLRAQDADVRPVQDLQGLLDHGFLLQHDLLHPDLLLQLKAEPRADGANDVGRTAFLPPLNVGHVIHVVGPDPL